MIINRDNYEVYLVDYADGTLAPELRSEMELFLKVNPGIRLELELFQEAPLVDKTETFDAKDQLKKIPYEKTTADATFFQTQCVAFIEGIMPDTEIDFFMEQLASDEKKQKEFALFQKTRLPKADVLFNEKILLKHQENQHKVTAQNFEGYCVACVEGWLNQSGLVALNRYISKNSESKQTFDLYKKLKLIPDVSIRYPDKHKLKKFTLSKLKNQRIFSYAASAAAALVFGMMAFYATRLKNPTELTSNISELDTQKTETPIAKIQPHVQENIVESQNKVKKILHDPFGFEKVASQQVDETDKFSNPERIQMQPMEPIHLMALDCKPCKEIFDGNPNLAIDTDFSVAVSHNYPQNNEHNAASNDIIWNVAQAGISGFNKITNAKIKVEKKETNQKTKIQFESKYFAFSTNVKNRNKH